MRILFVVFLLIGSTLNGMAEKLPMYISDVGVGMGASEQYSLAASWKPLYGFWNNRLLLGVGPRFSAVYTAAAPSFQPKFDNGSISSLKIHHALVAALNLMVEARVKILSWLELGANIDLGGIGFGNNPSGNYRSNTTLFNGSHTVFSPRYNYLLLGKYDEGQLDSELFASIRPWEKMSIRFGLSHYAIEFESRTALDGRRDFRRFSNFIFVATEYRF